MTLQPMTKWEKESKTAFTLGHEDHGAISAWVQKEDGGGWTWGIMRYNATVLQEEATTVTFAKQAAAIAYYAAFAVEQAHVPKAPQPVPEVPAERRQLYEDLTVTALEGGSNYWYFLPDLPMVLKHKDIKEPLSIKIFRAAFDRGESVPVHDKEESGTRGVFNEQTLLGYFNLANIDRAWQLMQDKYPRHFGDLFNDWDSTTADVWFQLAVMGKLVYG